MEQNFPAARSHNFKNGSQPAHPIIKFYHE
jgi:hypothetical protein